MLRWLVVRLAWMVVTLVGVTFVTFAMLRIAPVDRAEIEVARQQQDLGFHNLEARERAVLRLRLRYGTIDPDTLEPLPLWRGYANWIGNALQLRLAGPNDDNVAFLRRLRDALPVSLWLGFLALLVAGLVGVPLGAWLGMRADAPVDRAVSWLLFVAVGIPEFLLATLLLLGLAGAWLAWFPSSGLRSPGAEAWTFPRQLIDFAWHLVLPVTVMASAPTVLVTRFLRDSVARVAASPFAANLRALGVPPRVIRWRLVRNGGAPLATLAGSLLPMLVGGSIVVENLFALDGLGHLAFRAAEEQDQATVMTIVLLTSAVTLVALIVSDLLHRWVDPRVRFES
ncbi:MAG: ABC transporter permease [Planctomycetes bacterium]|nr:ABC transporter permease [Planctomycetota bacterium]